MGLCRVRHWAFLAVTSHKAINFCRILPPPRRLVGHQPSTSPIITVISRRLSSCKDVTKQLYTAE